MKTLNTAYEVLLDNLRDLLIIFMCMTWFKSVVFLVLLNISFCCAQKNIETQSLVWYGYSLKFKLNDNWTLEHNLDNRQFWFPGRQHQFIAHIKGYYDFGNGLKITPGFTFFQITLPQDPFEDFAYTVSELRPHIEIGYIFDISPKLNLHNRAMFEWRYFENSDREFAFRNYRYRHRIQLSYRFNKRFGFRVYDELILNLGKRIINNTFDQNRFGIAPKFYFDNGLSFEIGYLNWYQQQASGNDFFNRHILQIQVSKILDFSKTAPKLLQ